MGSFQPLIDSQSTSVSRSSWTYESLTDFPPISPVIQTHLKQVYVFHCCSLIASAVGAYLHIQWNIGGLLTTFATLGCMYWLLTPPPYEEPKKVALAVAFSLLHGASLGPVIKLAVDIDPSILMRSFMGAVIAVACFLGVAMIARHTQYLYLGGLLSSSLSILLYMVTFWFINIWWFYCSFSIWALFGVTGVCWVHGRWHQRDYKKGSSWRLGLCEACPHTFYWFHWCFCSHTVFIDFIAVFVSIIFMGKFQFHLKNF